MLANMPNQTQHFIEAERLLAEGVKTVNRIREMDDLRRKYAFGEVDEDSDSFRRATRYMDELGKKVMGIWAQAQVHATLAHVPDAHVGVELELSH